MAVWYNFCEIYLEPYGTARNRRHVKNLAMLIIIPYPVPRTTTRITRCFNEVAVASDVSVKM